MNCIAPEAGSRNQETRPTWALDELPPFPIVASRLMQLFARPEADITEIGRTIALEPVFAARVLQMANSPLFAVRGEVKSISHAIVLLGLSRVKAITVTRAIGDFVAPALRNRALRMCWQNSLAAAIIAEKIARACKMDVDLAYLGGLLRDIGRLALLVKYPDAYANLLAVSEENSYDLRSTEHELFEVDHCQAGAWMVQGLHFPPDLREAIEFHHDDFMAGTFRMVHLVHIADRLTDALGFAVLKPIDRQSFHDVTQLLPEPARARFTEDPEALTAEIDSRIQSWN